jgi:hypothetical protein
MTDYEDMQELAAAILKQAFVPMTPDGPVPQQPPPGAMPPGMDPAMMAGGMPAGMDPAMMAGGMPPMDPAMMDPAMTGGVPPMDPAMMDPAMAGGMPPMDPAMMGAAPADPAASGGMPSEAGGAEQDPAAADAEIKNMLKPIIQEILAELGIEGKEKKKSPQERMAALEETVAGIANKLGVPPPAPAPEEGAKKEAEAETGFGMPSSSLMDPTSGLPSPNYSGPMSVDPAFAGAIGDTNMPGIKTAGASRRTWAEDVAALAIGARNARRV